jgi:hypothetical protein
MDFDITGIESNFGLIDWCIVIGYLLIIVAFGVYIKRYISNVTDFIVAGRGLKTFLAVATRRDLPAASQPFTSHWLLLS